MSDDQALVETFKERPYIAASDAYVLLSKPKMERTFQRRAEEAHAAGDERVYKSGRQWMAPMEFWRAIQPRPAGRPPKYAPRRFRIVSP